MLRVGTVGSFVDAACVSAIDAIGGCGPDDAALESTINLVSSSMPIQWLACSWTHLSMNKRLVVGAMGATVSTNKITL